MAIELARTDHRGLLRELKATTREIALGIGGISATSIVSEPYEAFGLIVRYRMDWKPRGGRTGWKGRFFIGWRPVGENQVCGWLEGFERGDDRFVPAWVKAQAVVGGYAGLGETLAAPAVHRSGAALAASVAGAGAAEDDAAAVPPAD